MKRLFAALAALSLFACGADVPTPEQNATPQEIPITSKSPEAIEPYKKGRDLAENMRQAEAAEELNQAITLDPDFARAFMERGNTTFGPEGLKDLEQASAKAATVSKHEQLLIEATLAQRRGEFAKSEDLWKQLTEAVPNDWRAHMGLGSQLTFSQKYREGIESLSKATTLNPDAGPAFNMLGYAYLFEGQTGPAVEALKRYAALNPNEPNPHDSLGEALMAAGQFKEAEAAFAKAASLSPNFHIAWEGVAYTKFFAGDWAGGREAVDKAQQAAVRAQDRADVARLSAVAALAEGKTADGLKQLDAIAASPHAAPSDVGFTPVYRAMALAEGGRHREAIAEAAKAIEFADSGKLPAGVSTNLKHFALVIRAASYVALSDVAATEKEVAALDKEAATKPDNPTLQSTLHLARGILAAAQKDLKTAQTHFDKCASFDSYCHWQAALIGQRSGDSAVADASRARLLQVYRRNPVYLYARSSVNRALTRKSN
jgi:tetratricopeptide (TPR) repeat protein